MQVLMRSRLGALCLAAISGAAVLHVTGSPAFQPYFGRANPALVTGLVVAVAIASLTLLHSRKWLLVDRPAKGRRRFTLPATLATALALPVILVDVAGSFPADLNVPPPQSLLFYPVIALVAETIFHVAPVALLMLLGTRIAGYLDRRVLLWACLLTVTLLEPVFQVLAGAADSSPWVSAYVGAHLLVFNLISVYLFERSGFMSMYTFRLIYYVHWHIVWGALRLRILF
jgi:hypothetical protein